MISWGLINSENAFVANFIYPPEILMRLWRSSPCQTSCPSPRRLKMNQPSVSITHPVSPSPPPPPHPPPPPPPPRRADNSGSGTRLHRLTLLFFNLTQMHRG